MDNYFRREREAFFANYFPKERTGESVVYIHKKYLRPQPKGPEYGNFDSEKRADNTKGNPVDKHDKLQQLTNGGRTKSFKTLTNDNTNPKPSNDTVLEQTIKFAKDIALDIPVSDRDKYFYSVRVGKKAKKVKGLSHIETSRTKINRHKGNYLQSSIKESTHTTIEELHINQSLSCSLSEISARELARTSKRHDDSEKRQNQKDKVVTSESLQALATELAEIGEKKIKIHLMDDADKSLFTKGIQAPIIQAIKECIVELKHNRDGNVKEVEKVVKCNSDKIDYVLNKISNIESKIQPDKPNITNAAKTRSIGVNTNTDSGQITVGIKQPKSTLEELGLDFEDNGENNDISSEDDTDHYKKRNTSQTVTVDSKDEAILNGRSNLGSGDEGIPVETKTVDKLVKPVRPTNKIPTRFCWTDATKKY